VKFKSFLLLIIFFIAACGPEEDDAGMEITLPVSVQDIKPGPIQEFIQSTASVKAVKQAVLNSEVEGLYRLQKNPQTGKLFAPGDAAAKDQLIIVLENPEHENQVKIESQKLNLDISRREYDKQKSLYDKGGVTLRELINAERTFVEAKYTYENALLQLAKLKFTAPFDGIIVNLPYYTPGGEVPAGQVMAEIMDSKTLYAEVNFPAKEIIRIKPGQKVLVMEHSVSGDTLTGWIKDTSPAIDPVSRSFKASVLIDNKDLKFLPGMFVQLETITASRDSAIVIPKEIILSKRRGKTVYVVQKGAAFARVISTGLENDKFVEVIEGLKVEERLVIKGFETLRHKSKVKIVK